MSIWWMHNGSGTMVVEEIRVLGVFAMSLLSAFSDVIGNAVNL